MYRESINIEFLTQVSIPHLGLGKIFDLRNSLGMVVKEKAKRLA